MNSFCWEYFAWRFAYVAIKPGSIALASTLVGGGVANVMALAILLSGTLMASLSLGTYRNVFKYSGAPGKQSYFNSVRKSVFLLNFLLLGLVALLLQVAGLDTVCFLFLFIITEHVVHDDSRIYLYSGDRLSWARSNFLRTLFIPLIPILSFYYSISIEFVMFILFLLGLGVSYRMSGLLRVGSGEFALLAKRVLFVRYFSQFHYFLASTSNRCVQQSDKFLFSMLSYENFWVYTLVCQIANVPLMFFEMTFMSEFKSKVAKKVNYTFSWLNLKQVLSMGLVSVASAILFVMVSMRILELNEILFISLFSMVIAVNFVAATSMKNSESLFWSMNTGSRFARLEMGALIWGHVVAIPILAFGAYWFVKVPNLASLLIKLWNAKRWLN